MSLARLLRCPLPRRRSGSIMPMRPPVFAKLEFAAAREQAAAERKLLLVDATAEWCGPCKLMDRTTWIDPNVVAWLEEHALAIQIDVDAQTDVARQLRVE